MPGLKANSHPLVCLQQQVTPHTDAAQVQSRPGLGCYVSGLYLEGAAWDVEAGKLKRQAPRQTVDELPVLQVRCLPIVP